MKGLQNLSIIDATASRYHTSLSAIVSVATQKEDIDGPQLQQSVKVLRRVNIEVGPET